MGGDPEDNQRQWAVKPGMLPDFPDSKVSGPMYQLNEPQEDQPPRKESVWLTRELPQSEIPDEALRTKWRGDDRQQQVPQWVEVDDEVMEEQMSEEERVRDWLEHTVQPQDSVSV